MKPILLGVVGVAVSLLKKALREPPEAAAPTKTLTPPVDAKRE